MRVSVGSGGCFPSVTALEFTPRGGGVHVRATDHWHGPLRVDVQWTTAEFAHFVEQFIATVERSVQLHAERPIDPQSRPLPVGPSPWLSYELDRAQDHVSCSLAAAAATAEWLSQWIAWSAAKPGAKVLRGPEAPPGVTRRLGGRVWAALIPWVLFYSFVALVSFIYWLVR